MGRNLENRNEWYKQKYLKFGADLDKEYCEKLKQTIKDDKDYKSIADWIKERADKYLKEKNVKF